MNLAVWSIYNSWDDHLPSDLGSTLGETAAGCVRPSRPRPTQAAAPSRTAGAELWHGAGVGTTLGGPRVDGSHWDFWIFSRVFGIGFSTYSIIRWDPIISIMDYPISGNFDYPMKWISGNPILWDYPTHQMGNFDRIIRRWVSPSWDWCWDTSHGEVRKPLGGLGEGILSRPKVVMLLLFWGNHILQNPGDLHNIS